MQWVIQIQCIRIFPNKLLKLAQKILKFLEQQGKNFLYFTRFSSQNKISSEDILPGLRVSGCGLGITNSRKQCSILYYFSSCQDWQGPGQLFIHKKVYIVRSYLSLFQATPYNQQEDDQPRIYKRNLAWNLRRADRTIKPVFLRKKKHVA